MAIAEAAFAVLELALMRAETPEQFGSAIRWMHVPAWVIIVSLVGFVRLYLRAGRRWLAWAVVGVRTLSLIFNFGFSPNINYREITAVRHIPFLGESVSVAEGVANPWMLVAQLSLLLLVVFVTDAAITVWRRGDRRQGLVLSIVFFVLAATADAVLIAWGIISMPLTASLFYQGIVAAMGYGLSYDLFRAAQLAKQFQASEAALHESEERINLVSNVANLGLWVWDIRNDELWVTEKWRRLLGFAESEPVSFDRVLQVVHPEDRERMKQLVQHAFEGSGGEYENEYRITRPDGSTCWIAGYGGVELDERGKPAFARGVSRDITKRKLAEEKFQLALDAAPNAMIMVDSAGVITFANATATTVFGYSLTALIGRHIETLIPERFRDRHVGDRKGFLSEPSSRAMGAGRDLFGRRKDGSEFPVEVGLNPIHTGQGLFVLASVIDITARKQAELEHQLQIMELARVGRVAVMGELGSSLEHEVTNPIAAMV